MNNLLSSDISHKLEQNAILLNMQAFRQALKLFQGKKNV